MSEQTNIINLSDNSQIDESNEVEFSEEAKQTEKIDETKYQPIVDYTGMSEQEIAQAALDRIEEQSNIACGPVPGIFIYKSLIKDVNNNNELAKRILIKSKTLQNCFCYIMQIMEQRARQMKEAAREISYLNNKDNNRNSNAVCVGVSDREIIDLVIEYYMLDDKALDMKKAAEKSKAEKAKKKAEETRKATQKQSSTKKENKKPEKKKEKANEPQGSLFSMLGDDE